MNKNKIASTLVAGTMALALISASGARPVAAARAGVAVSEVGQVAQPEWFAEAGVAVVAGAAGGAARGAVVALFGTPAITGAVVTGAVAGAAAGFVAYGVVSLFGTLNAEGGTFDTASLSMALDH